MSLRDQIHDDQISAMKNRDASRAAPLRMLWSAIRNEEIAKQRDLTDEDVQTVVSRQIKQLLDAKKDFEAGGRNDLIAQTKEELATLQQYVPAQLTDDELRPIVQEAIGSLGATSAGDIGKVMGAVMKTAKGKADGNRVRAMAADMLNSSSA